MGRHNNRTSCNNNHTKTTPKISRNNTKNLRTQDSNHRFFSKEQKIELQPTIENQLMFNALWQMHLRPML